MPRLHSDCADLLWRSDWRSLVSEHGLGSVDELIQGRGPDGLVEAHLMRLEDSGGGVRMDETTCRLAEHLGLCPATLAALTTWVPDLIVMEGEEQLAAVGTRTARLPLQPTWSAPHWFARHDAGGSHVVLSGLPPVPETAATGATGRLLREVVDHAAFVATHARVRGMTTGADASFIQCEDTVVHDGPALARRARRMRENFDRDPLGDPFLAHEAAALGFDASRISWGRDTAKGALAMRGPIPHFVYERSHRTKGLIGPDIPARLTHYTRHGFNYSRDGERVVLHLCDALPESVVAALGGRRLTDVFDHEGLNGITVESTEVDDMGRTRVNARFDRAGNTRITCESRMITDPTRRSAT